jgi:hypothetical protein
MGQLPDVGASVFRIAVRSMVTKQGWAQAPFSDQSGIWQRVGDIFTIFTGGPRSRFSSAGAYVVSGPVAASTLNPWEPVVYLVDSFKKSVVGPRFKMALDPASTGSTYVGGALNMSEVYLLHDAHDTPETLANTIIHELMHNKLNMGDAMHDLASFVGDMGGFMQSDVPHNTALKPTSGDISNMAPVLSTVVPRQIGV